MSGFPAKAVIVVIALLLLAIVIARAFRRPDPVKTAAKRQRMPVLVLLVGIALFAIGFILALGSFTSPFHEQLLLTRIAGVSLFVIGLGVIVAHHNWYLETGTDAVHYRTVFGREHLIAYRDIVSCSRVGSGRRERLIIRGSSGQRLTVRLAYNDASRVLAAVRVS